MNKLKSPLPHDTFHVANRSVSRVINQTAIVDMIYQHGGISKAKLAKELGISKPAISSNVANLISIGLVEEKGKGVAAGKSGGRKPQMLYVNPTIRYAGALDLSFREPVCAVCDLQYNIVGLCKIQVQKNTPAEERRQRVLEAFLSIFEDKGLSPDVLGTIVITQPGIIADESSKCYSQKRHHAWTEIGLKAYLQQKLGIPVSVRNDVNMAAIGEMHFGLDRQLSDLIYVSCGIGLGIGIVINGNLHEGGRRAAGEIGYSVTSDGHTAEDALAMDGLIKRVEVLYAESGRQDEITFPYIVEMARSGDEIVNRAIFETGRELGRLIFNCCTLLDIPTVVFGGEYLELGQALFDGIEDVIIETPMFRPEVVPSSLKQIAGIYGGFAAGKERIIQSLING